MNRSIKARAPGRICLFGEHQDYLGLPVITAAIDLEIEIALGLQEKTHIDLDLPDIQSRESFSPLLEAPYRQPRDYVKSVFNQFFRKGFLLPFGVRGSVHGTIPINAGCASSSALCVAWTLAMMELVNHPERRVPFSVARWAHKAEVLEFEEPGGMMDHITAALGMVQYIEFKPEVRTVSLPPISGAFVLGNSLEPKDTLSILSRVKNGTLKAVRKIKSRLPDFDLAFCRLEELPALQSILDKEEFTLLRAAVLNRNITLSAMDLFASGKMSNGRMGILLNRLQEILREDLRISTPKINRMLDAALHAGSLGGKINGSGGGGCMFVFAPENPHSVAEAIRREGGIPQIIP